MLAGRQDVLGIALVALVAQRTVELIRQDFREAIDRVQRRAQLVAHIGQEGGLGMGRMFGLGLFLRIFPRQFALAPFGPLQVERGLVHLRLLLLQLFLVADILCHIHPDGDEAAIERRALDQLDPALGVQLQQSGLRIFQRRMFGAQGPCPRNVHRMMRHARPQRFIQQEIRRERAVPVKQALAIVPQCKRAVEPFNGRAQPALGRFHAVFRLFALGDVQDHAAINIGAGVGIGGHAAAQFHPPGRLEARHETGLHPPFLVALPEGGLNALLVFGMHLRQHFIDRDLAIAQHAQQLGRRVAEIDSAGIVRPLPIACPHTQHDGAHEAIRLDLLHWLDKGNFRRGRQPVHEAEDDKQRRRQQQSENEEPDQIVQREKRRALTGTDQQRAAPHRRAPCGGPAEQAERPEPRRRPHASRAGQHPARTEMRVRNENAGPGLACRQPCPGRRKRQDDGVVGGRCRDNEVALPGQADPVTAGEHRLCHGHRRRQTAIVRRGPGIFQGHDHIDAGRRRRNRRARGARIRSQPHGHLGGPGMSCQTGSNRA